MGRVSRGPTLKWAEMTRGFTLNFGGPFFSFLNKVTPFSGYTFAFLFSTGQRTRSGDYNTNCNFNMTFTVFTLHFKTDSKVQQSRLDLHLFVVLRRVQQPG